MKTLSLQGFPMKKVIFIIILLSTTVFSTPAISGPLSDKLGSCMVDSLNGKERKKLAQWIFLAMSAHPDIQKFSNVTKEIQDETDRDIGNLITRLLTKDCLKEAETALDKESQTALKNSFELVGKVAMQELMANSNVASSITGYVKYLDKSKIDALMGRK